MIDTIHISVVDGDSRPIKLAYDFEGDCPIEECKNVFEHNVQRYSSMNLPDPPTYELVSWTRNGKMVD